MRKIPFSAFLLLLLSFSFSCNKDEPEAMLITDYISNLNGGRYAFVTVARPATDQWRIIKTSYLNGNRASTLKLTPPRNAEVVEQELKEDDKNEMKWIVNRQQTDLNVPNGSKFLVSIHSAINKRYYWSVQKGGSVNGTLQLRIVVQDYDGDYPTIEDAGPIPDVQDAAKFYATEIEKNGKKYYHFESLLYPGYFLVNEMPAGTGIIMALKQNISAADIEAHKQ